MTVEVDGESWTLSVRGDRAHVDAGSQRDAARVRLEPDQLEGLVHDQQTFMGMWANGRLDQPAGRVVDLPTRTGDVTVHLSCTLHMAQPPVERERRVMDRGFSLPLLDPKAAAEGRARLRAVRQAAPVTVSQPLGYSD